MNSIDWNLLQTFVHAAEAESFTEAAVALGVSQPTVSRHIQQLEEAVGVGLFIRHARGLELTDRGVELLASAREVEHSVQGLMRRVGGMGREVRGSVRVSASGPVSVRLLPECFAGLRRAHPELTLELVVDNRASNLLRREADIAVRMFRPEQLDLICTHVGDGEMGLFASTEYLDRRGRPMSLDEFDGHDVIGEDRGTAVDATLARLGLDLSPTDFSLRTDNFLAHLAAIRAGLGIGGAQVSVLVEDPGVERVLPSQSIGVLSYWVVMHREVRQSAAIRVVYDALVGFLRKRVGG